MKNSRVTEYKQVTRNETWRHTLTRSVTHIRQCLLGMEVGQSNASRCLLHRKKKGGPSLHCGMAIVQLELKQEPVDRSGNKLALAKTQ